MKYWNVDESLVAGELPRHVCVRMVSIVHALNGIEGDSPRLTKIAVSDNDLDCWRYQFEVELQPGVVLPVGCGLLEDGVDFGDPDVASVVDAVMEGVLACVPRLDHLAETLHSARMRTRRILGAWHAAGTTVKLIDVRLAPYDHWRGDREPSLEVVVETLDDRLESRLEEISVSKLDALEVELSDRRQELRDLLDDRARMLELGASGTVEQLALTRSHASATCRRGCAASRERSGSGCPTKPRSR